MDQTPLSLTLALTLLQHRCSHTKRGLLKEPVYELLTEANSPVVVSLCAIFTVFWLYSNRISDLHSVVNATDLLLVCTKVSSGGHWMFDRRQIS